MMVQSSPSLHAWGHALHFCICYGRVEYYLDPLNRECVTIRLQIGGQNLWGFTLPLYSGATGALSLCIMELREERQAQQKGEAGSTKPAGQQR